MTSLHRDTCFKDLIEWLGDYELSIFLESRVSISRLKSIYKKLHALLIFRLLILGKMQAPCTFLSKIKDPDYFKDYYAESVSDINQAILLWCQGLFKPSLLILRSSAENHFRWIALINNVDVISLTSTYDLIDKVKKAAFYKNSSFSKKYINQLHVIYVELCSYVHSAHTHLDMSDKFAEFPNISDPEAQTNYDHIENIIKLSLALTAIILHKDYMHLHHEDIDYISDVLPRKLKKYLHDN